MLLYLQQTIRQFFSNYLSAAIGLIFFELVQMLPKQIFPSEADNIEVLITLPQCKTNKTMILLQLRLNPQTNLIYNSSGLELS